ncbi:MAG: DinB family protein [Phycisphaeraceae bacterium]|nr:DinB family protein [Phycisphaeraceae bacterium]
MTTMRFDLDRAMQVLARTPGTLRTLLSGLDDAWLHGNYGEATFSPFDVVGHLITGERIDWMGRIRRILESGVSRPFDVYDRYAQFERSSGRDIEPLLTEFARLRDSNVAALRELKLSPADLSKRGLHPVLGEVTLDQVMATWVAHDLNHLAQIAKAMAWQYREAVGPWHDFLGVLRTPGTTMDADGAARRRAALERQTPATEK